MSEQCTLARHTKPRPESAARTPVPPGGRAGAPPVWAGLSRRIGNAALSRLVQARLGVSQPDDPQEQEAERLAHEVTRMPAPSGGGPVPGVQRFCPACAQELERQEAPVPEEEDRGPIARRATGIAPDGTVTAEVEGALGRLAGRGTPLPQPVRTDLEPRFGAEFSAVRVHTDGEAQSLARAVGAEAFTLGTEVVFGAGRYAPETPTGRHLLAHELTHVLQQGQGRVQARLQRETCPARGASEVADSRAPPGLLAQNVVVNAAQTELVVQDFGVERTDLPPGVRDDPGWQRAMSQIVGDPSVLVALGGYSDCAGSAQENFALRDRRADQVRAAMPAAAQAKVLVNMPVGTATYLGPNDTAQDRARNRAVKVWISPGAAGVAGQDPCTMLPRARNMDEFLFLLRCAETRLAGAGVTAPLTVLSAIRQLYYGNAAWSVNQAALWDTVIAVRPYPSGSDLPGTLGAGLYDALRRTDTVDGVAIGHLFTGIDAMAQLSNITVGSRFQLVTGLVNQEVATWSGDVGSAAAEFLLDDLYGRRRFNGTLQGYFSQGYAQDDDLRADVESYALRLGLQPGGAPAAVAAQPLTLNRPLSAALLDVYRILSTNLAGARRDAKHRFLEAYGGTFAGAGLANRPQVFTTLQGSVNGFALPFALKEFGDRLRKRGAPPGVPDLNAFLPIVAQRLPPLVDQATDLFIDWLLRP